MARSISDEEVQLKRRARRRLIGAIVLVTAIVVALPMVLDTEPKPIGGDVSIKIPSPDSGNFSSRVVPVPPSGEAPSAPAAKLSTELKPPPAKASASPGDKPADPPAAAGGTKPDSPAPAKAVTRLEPPAMAKADTAAKKDQAADKPAAGPPAEAQFVVQVIALADAEKAKEIQAQIATAGIKAYTEVVKTAKGDVTRVRGGPFATRAAAENARDQLKAIGLAGNVVPK